MIYIAPTPRPTHTHTHPPTHINRNSVPKSIERQSSTLASSSTRERHRASLEDANDDACVRLDDACVEMHALGREMHALGSMMHALGAYRMHHPLSYQTTVVNATKPSPTACITP
jgi:hypothetical protein